MASLTLADTDLALEPPLGASVTLEALRVEAGTVAHAVRNPLAVIVGNAQLLSAMARLSAIDPALSKPIEDIEAAAEQLGEALAGLTALRRHIAAALGGDGGL